MINYVLYGHGIKREKKGNKKNLRYYSSVYYKFYKPVNNSNRYQAFKTNAYIVALSVRWREMLELSSSFVRILYLLPLVVFTSAYNLN